KPPFRSLHPIVLLTLSRVKEFYREPSAVFWVYGFPLILAVALSLAFPNKPIELIPVDIQTDGATSVVIAEQIEKQLQADKRLLVTRSDEATARNRLRIGKTGVVIIPGENGSGNVRFLLDENRPDSTLARAVAESALLNARTGNAWVPKITTIEEPGSRYIDFLIPGLIGTNLMGGGLWGVGFVTVDMRVRKLLKRFLATPMQRSHFLVSLLLSRLLFMFVEVLIFLTFAYFVFGIQVHGSWLALLLVMGAGGVAFAGIGLLVACRAKTIETVSGLMNAIMLPMYLLSGVFFSAERFPDWAQPVIRRLPLTELTSSLRAVMNDGDGLAATLPAILTLLAWGGLSFALALRLFRWR
ncbi:MAG: ABC transporter permease, partial [Gemmataceae bacterium]